MFTFGGRITYYANNHCFEANCMCGHGKCVLTRTCRGKRSGAAVPRGGRPLGFLAAWLHAGLDCPSKAAHWHADAFQSLSYERRCAARAALMLQPNCEVLLAAEREQMDGESEEPENLDGLWG